GRNIISGIRGVEEKLSHYRQSARELTPQGRLRWKGDRRITTIQTKKNKNNCKNGNNFSIIDYNIME
ncbi:876_t:CDS:2, partial [Entrophospora sp. SA101]